MGGGGPCDFSVSPRSKSFLFGGGLLFDLGACWDKGLDSDLDQGLTKIEYLYTIPNIYNLVRSSLDTVQTRPDKMRHLFMVHNPPQ